MTDLYQYADKNMIGMTQCVPLTQYNEFFGTLCLDQQPEGDLNAYYPFNTIDRATYLLFNEDKSLRN